MLIFGQFLRSFAFCSFFYTNRILLVTLQNIINNSSRIFSQLWDRIDSFTFVILRYYKLALFYCSFRHFNNKRNTWFLRDKHLKDVMSMQPSIICLLKQFKKWERENPISLSQPFVPFITALYKGHQISPAKFDYAPFLVNCVNYQNVKQSRNVYALGPEITYCGPRVALRGCIPAQVGKTLLPCHDLAMIIPWSWWNIVMVMPWRRHCGYVSLHGHHNSRHDHGMITMFCLIRTIIMVWSSCFPCFWKNGSFGISFK